MTRVDRSDGSGARADEARVTETFPELVRIDSPTSKEQAIVHRAQGGRSSTREG